MLKLQMRKKRTAIIAVAAVLTLSGAGAAFAYWSSTGTGTGSATTGQSTAFAVESQPATGDPMTPGGAAQTVAFSVTNSNTGDQELFSVTAIVANSDGSAWTSVPGCSADDYLVGTPAIAYGQIDGGGHADGTVTIAMRETRTNQDACQNVVVPLYVVAS